MTIINYTKLHKHIQTRASEHWAFITRAPGTASRARTHGVSRMRGEHVHLYLFINSKLDLQAGNNTNGI